MQVELKALRAAKKSKVKKELMEPVPEKEGDDQAKATSKKFNLQSTKFLHEALNATTESSMKTNQTVNLVDAVSDVAWVRLLDGGFPGRNKVVEENLADGVPYHELGEQHGENKNVPVDLTD